MIDAIIQPDGNLALSIPEESDRIEFMDEVRKHGYYTAMAFAFEDYSGNGSFTHFDAGDGNPFVGLTSAPCVAEEMSTEDDGTNVIEGRCWVFTEYAIVNDAEKLGAGETAIYTLVGDATS